jgi:hypothetical protein
MLFFSKMHLLLSGPLFVHLLTLKFEQKIFFLLTYLSRKRNPIITRDLTVWKQRKQQTLQSFKARARAHCGKTVKNCGQNCLPQGCQMVSFQTKNPNLGKFWMTLDWKMLIYFRAIWNILETFRIFYDHLVQFVFIWCIFSGLGNINREKSGNPGFPKRFTW